MRKIMRENKRESDLKEFIKIFTSEQALETMFSINRLHQDKVKEFFLRDI
jgi:hypothetical protein